MRSMEDMGDESTEKFEIELANEQVKKIKQAINDCQLRFGKVMGCGTCKALQLCTWAKELSSTIESMGKYIEALQAGNEQLQAQNAAMREALEWAGSALGQSPCLCRVDSECMRCQALTAIDKAGGGGV